MATNDSAVRVCEMHPTAHERGEWRRMAEVAGGATEEFLLAAVAMPTMPLAHFDRVQAVYRAWLVFDEIPAQEARR